MFPAAYDDDERLLGNCEIAAFDPLTDDPCSAEKWSSDEAAMHESLARSRVNDCLLDR